MKKGKLLLLAGFIAATATLNIQAQKIIKLPEPVKKGGKPLMEALAKRQTTRAFSSKEFSPQMLSNLLWAAFGINRDTGKRTAPSAYNFQEISIYVALPKGLYLWNPKTNELKQLQNKDIREETGIQKFTQTAPVNLIYVVNYNKMPKIKGQKHKEIYAFCDTGFISQNVYLFAASEGLATVVLGWVDRAKLEKVMNLPENEKVILTQPVGYRK